MAQLNTKIKLYCKANSVDTVDFTKDVILLKQPEKDLVIDSWNLSIDQPTDAQLDNYETAGNILEANINIDTTRQTQYLSWQQQMEMIYKDQKDGTTTFKDHCDKVRSDNPKE